MIGKEPIRNSRCATLMMDLHLQMIPDSSLEATLHDLRVDGAEIDLLDRETGEFTHASHRGLFEACAKEAEATPSGWAKGLQGVSPRQRSPRQELERKAS
jgi:hypothetical protein